MIYSIGLSSLSAQAGDTINSISPTHSNPDLLFQKAKRQKTTGWVLLAGGAGLALAGGIVAASSIHIDEDPSNFFGVFSQGAQTGGAMVLIGAASMVGSIPFFISSCKNRRRAIIMIRDEALYIPGKTKENFIAVGFRVNL